jgi:hypothetical protein
MKQEEIKLIFPFEIFEEMRIYKETFQHLEEFVYKCTDACGFCGFFYSSYIYLEYKNNIFKIIIFDRSIEIFDINEKELGEIKIINTNYPDEKFIKELKQKLRNT